MTKHTYISISAEITRENTKLIDLQTQLEEAKGRKAILIGDQIKECQSRIDTLTQERETIKKVEVKEGEINVEEQLKSKIINWLNQHPSAYYIAKTNQYVLVEDHADDCSMQNVSLNSWEEKPFIVKLARGIDVDQSKLTTTFIKSVFQSQNRIKDNLVYSVSKGKWNHDTYIPYTFMEPYFINNRKIDTRLVNPEFYFNILMHSLSGGKQENQDHIEQWVLHKVINYQSPINTPELVIIGHVGGEGKGTFYSIVKQMFPSGLVGLANTKTLTGGFNRVLENKLVAVFDDQKTSDIPFDVVKQYSGNEEIIIEGKGADQINAEKCFSGLWLANHLPFPLDAGDDTGVYRRFSFITTNIKFFDALKELDPKARHLNENEIKKHGQDVIEKILHNTTYIAGWFNYLKNKHTNVYVGSTINALHGQDYNSLKQQNETTFDRIWRVLVEPALANGQTMPVFVINEIIRHLDGEELAPKTIGSLIQQKINATRTIPLESARLYVSIKSSQADIGIKMQTTVVSVKGRTKHHFNWWTISKGVYKKPERGSVAPLITEDDLLFDLPSKQLPQAPESSNKLQVLLKSINNDLM